MYKYIMIYKTLIMAVLQECVSVCVCVFEFAVLFRTTQQLSSCGNAGQMSVCALMAIRAWVWMAGWWSFSGFLTHSLWTPKNPFCMTSLWRTDSSGYSQMAPCFMPWGSHLLLIVSQAGRGVRSILDTLLLYKTWRFRRAVSKFKGRRKQLRQKHCTLWHQ